MENIFTPRLDALPAAQSRLWPELSSTPGRFTLYGGTAIALRLDHRQSEDFDFFSREPFEPRVLLAEIPYLAGAKIRQTSPNTLTVSVDRDGPILLSYFGNLDLGQIEPADFSDGPHIKVASLLDVAGMKAAVVTQRAETKDYIDLHALITHADLKLPKILAAASVIYGEEFTPLLALKAIAYHDDPSLTGLSRSVRQDLIAAVRETDIRNLPTLNPIKRKGNAS